MFAAETACPGCGRSACRSAAKTSSVPSRPSTHIAAATSATTSSSRRSCRARHEHPEHAVGAVDERQALLLLELDRRDAGSRPGRRPPASARRRPSRTSPSPMRASAQCESGARSPEHPSEPYSCTTGAMPGVEHRHVGGQGLLADAGAPGRQGRDAQQHERPHDLALDLGAGAGGVRADQRALQLGALLDGDVPRGQRAEAGRDAVVRLGVVRQPADHLAGAPHLGQGLVGQAHRGTVARDPHDVLDAERAGADANRLHPRPGVDVVRSGCRAVVTRVRRGHAGSAGFAHVLHWSATDAAVHRFAPGIPSRARDAALIPCARVRKWSPWPPFPHSRRRRRAVRPPGPARWRRRGRRTGHRPPRARRACRPRRAGRGRAPRSCRRRGRSRAGGRW